MSFLFVHSLTESKLLKALELGGFPLPSIAVIKPDTNFNNYGNITFIIKPEVLNPKDKKNLVYDRDIFSQRIPETEYDVNKKNFDKVYEELFNKSKGFEMFFNFHDIDSLKRKSSSYIEDRFMSSMLLKKEYFSNYNKDYIIPQKKRKLSSVISENKEFVKFITNNPIDTSEDFKNIILKALEERELYYKGILGDDVAKSIVYDYKNSLFDFIDGQYTFKNDNMTLKYNKVIIDILKDKDVLSGNDKEIDRIKFEKDINSYIYENTNSFNKYVKDNYLDKILSNPHFKVGNKKHPYTLESIEKLMLKQKVIGIEDTSDTSIGKISSHFAKQFKSFDDIENNLNLLNFKEERFDKKDDLHRKIFDVSEQLSSFHDSNRFFDVQEGLSLALKHATTKEGLIRSLKINGFTTENIPDSIIENCLNITKDIIVLDNHYFEGKPQKTLHLDDFQAVLLPKNISSELVDKLKDKVKIHFYDKDDVNSKSTIFETYKYNVEKKLNKSLTIK